MTGTVSLTGASLDAIEVRNETSCPVCGSGHIRYEDTNTEVSDTIYVDYRCRSCGSEFSHRYEWTGAYVFRDGRFGEGE